MKAKKVLLLACVFVAGCTHTHAPGTVSMKINDRISHVTLGKNDVKVGDAVAFFKDTCQQEGIKAGSNSPCHKTKVAEGKVLEVLNDKYSAVRVSGGSRIDEGTRVEKVNPQSIS